MQKKAYVVPDLIVYGNIETLTGGARYFVAEDDPEEIALQELDHFCRSSDDLQSSDTEHFRWHPPPRPCGHSH